MNIINFIKSLFNKNDKLKSKSVTRPRNTVRKTPAKSTKKSSTRKTSRTTKKSTRTSAKK